MKHRSRRVYSNESDHQRCPSLTRVRHGRDIDGHCVLYALDERATFTAGGIGNLAKYNHGVGKVDTAKARIVVGQRTRLASYVLPSELVGAVDEERFDASGRRFGDSTHHKGLLQYRCAPCDNPSL